MSNGMKIINWGRFFALYDGEELVCVTVYKKGAQEVRRKIEELKVKIQNNQTNKRKEREDGSCRKDRSGKT